RCSFRAARGGIAADACSEVRSHVALRPSGIRVDSRSGSGLCATHRGPQQRCSHSVPHRSPRVLGARIRGRSGCGDPQIGDRARDRSDSGTSRCAAYVGRDDAENLSRDVREYEPRKALVAGEPGCEMSPALIEEASKSLRPNGILVVEIGYDGAEYVGSLLSASSWSELIVTRDLAGIERVISARLPA